LRRQRLNNQVSFGKYLRHAVTEGGYIGQANRLREWNPAEANERLGPSLGPAIFDPNANLDLGPGSGERQGDQDYAVCLHKLLNFHLRTSVVVTH
jgi:hypothetical protein